MKNFLSWRCMLWVEVIIVTFLEAVESIDVLTECINDVKLGQNLTRLHNLHDFMLIVLFFWENKQIQLW